jgi:hypothetical protein
MECTSQVVKNLPLAEDDQVEPNWSYGEIIFEGNMYSYH